MGVPAEEALAAVRFSLGSTSTLTDVNHLLQTLPPLLASLLTTPLLEELLTAP
jgi:cysteine desulfurase